MMAEAATQALTVVQPPAPSYSLDAGAIGGWAGILVGIAAAIAIIYKMLTKELSRDIADLKKENASVRSDLQSERDNRVKLETTHGDTVQRVVRLEIGQANIEKGQERIEAQIEKNHREQMDAMKAWSDQFSESIREIRTVGPKP